MSVGFTLTIDDADVAAALGRIRAIGADMVPLWHDIGAEGEDSTRRRFDTNLAPDGTPWTPSLRATVVGGKTLVQDGFLRDSIVYHLDGPDAVEWGSNLIYAAIHQTGGEIHAKTAKGLAFTLATGEFAIVRKVTMPARPYLGLASEDKAEILDIVGRHFSAAVGPASGGVR